MKLLFSLLCVTAFNLIATGYAAHAQDKNPPKPVTVTITNNQISGYRDEQGKVITQKEFISYIQTGNYITDKKSDGAGKFFLQLICHPKPEVKPVYIKP